MTKHHLESGNLAISWQSKGDQIIKWAGTQSKDNGYHGIEVLASEIFINHSTLCLLPEKRNPN